MPKLIVLVGPPGSGKSSLAASICYEKNAHYINQDTQGKEHLKIFNDLLNLEPKQDIVIDRLNFNKQQRSRYIDPAKKVGYTNHIIVLHQSRETCLNRCMERKQHPTIKTEEDRNNAINMFFSKYERPSLDEADIVEFRYPENRLNSAIICDIDNTLSSSNHRQHHLQDSPRKNWKAFFDDMHLDPVNIWCKKIVMSMWYDNHHVILCSGRPDNYRQVTTNWLKENRIHYRDLFMRPRNDSRSDVIVKEILLDFEILSRYKEVSFCIDDRKCVIDMYRSRGLTVLDCAGEAGNF